VTFSDPVFKAFNGFDIDDMLPQADTSRRMLRRLDDTDSSTTAGPTAPAAHAALANQRRGTRRSWTGDATHRTDKTTGDNEI
jgi:hypothetical protein